MARKPAGRQETRRNGTDLIAARAPRKLIAFDPSTLQELELLGRDSMKDLQELAEEAFRDLLKKHDRPASLKDALRRSARREPANDSPQPAGKTRKPRRN